MADDLDSAAVGPLDLDGVLPDVYYDIRSRNDEWTTATGPVPRSTYLMDTEILLLLVARLEAALTTARRDALTAARAGGPTAPTVSAERVDAARAPMYPAVEMVREHYRVECVLDDSRTRLYRSHVGIMLDALDAARAREPAAPTVSTEQVDAAWREATRPGLIGAVHRFLAILGIEVTP